MDGLQTPARLYLSSPAGLLPNTGALGPASPHRRSLAALLQVVSRASNVVVRA
jgi:hypothetical protein